MAGYLSGKKVLITGATDGLGKTVAGHLAWENAIVMLHGRNPAKGEEVLREIYNDTMNEDLIYYNADFSLFEQVNDMAARIKAEHNRFDILVNNAALGSGLADGNKRELTEDGIELRFAVNYLSQVLLTEKLIPSLHNGSVIINVVSTGQEPIDFDDLMLCKSYDGFEAYKRSKTALIMYTFDLAERLKDKGIKVNAVHPASLMNTKMVLKDWGYSLSTVEQGAKSVENLVNPETTGSFYNRTKISTAIIQAYDPDARQRLRKVTAELLKKYHEFSDLQKIHH